MDNNKKKVDEYKENYISNERKDHDANDKVCGNCHWWREKAIRVIPNGLCYEQPQPIPRPKGSPACCRHRMAGKPEPTPMPGSGEPQYRDG